MKNLPGQIECAALIERGAFIFASRGGVPASSSPGWLFSFDRHPSGSGSRETGAASDSRVSEAACLNFSGRNLGETAAGFNFFMQQGYGLFLWGAI